MSTEKVKNIKIYLWRKIIMRLNRIIVGEVRGAEAIDMVQCLNTGHDGYTTYRHSYIPYFTYI